MIIEYIKNPRTWENEYINGDTIWEYDNAKNNLFHQISALCILKQFLEFDNHAEVIFYDSY